MSDTIIMTFIKIDSINIIHGDILRNIVFIGIMKIETKMKIRRDIIENYIIPPTSVNTHAIVSIMCNGIGGDVSPIGLQL